MMSIKLRKHYYNTNIRLYNKKVKEMHEKTGKQYYAKNKDKIRKHQSINKNIQKRSHLKRTYNITLEQFEQMKISQNNRCVVCDNIFKNNNDTHVDHNHNTGKVRQLLCRKCNVALGMLEDNYNRILKLAEYIKKWQ